MKRSLLLPGLVLIGLSSGSPAMALGDPGLAAQRSAAVKGAIIRCDQQPASRACQAAPSGRNVRVAVDGRLSIKGAPGFKAKKAAGHSFDITSAKTVRIRFLGYKELTGEYSINADATVSIPVLGRISVANMNAARLERVLSNKVTSLTGRKGYATVEVTRYKPVFVTGIVKDSRSYAWNPGMTVLHAITLAGGTSRILQSGLNIPLQTNNERSRLQQATNSLKRSMARLARLRSERQGSNRLAASPELVKLVGQAEAARLMLAETEILKTNNKAHTSQFSTIRQAIKTAAEELKTMRTQGQLIKRQIKLRRRHHNKIKALKNRRLVSGTTLLELETKIAEAEEKSLTALVARARLQGRLLDLQRELLVIKQKKEGAIDQKILKLEKEIASHQISRSTAQKAMRALNGGVDMAIDGKKPRAPGFEIVRETRDGARTFKVDKFTPLRPGDIVVVSR